MLLSNKGDLLPLDRSKVKSIAVIGPHADLFTAGGYSGQGEEPGHAAGGDQESRWSGNRNRLRQGMRNHAATESGTAAGRRGGRVAQGGRGREESGCGDRLCRHDAGCGAGGTRPHEPEPARKAGGADQGRSRGQSAHGRGGNERRAAGGALGEGARAGDHRGVVGGRGRRQRDRGRDLRRCEPGRPNAADGVRVGQPGPAAG